MKITRPILIIAAILWLFAVIIFYYVAHKPFAIENALALLDALASIGVATAIFFLGVIFGRRLTRTLEFGSTLEALCLRAGLGLGLLSFATFGLGLVGALNPFLFWAFLLAGIFLLHNDARATLGDLRASFASFRDSLASFRAPIFFVAVTLVIALWFALTPPIAWDAQTYHLVKAKHAVELGRIAPPPDIVYFSFPSLGEMLFLAAMLLKGDIAAQLTHLGFFALMLGAVLAFACRYFNPSVAWFACAILVAVPSLLLVATYAYVDATLAFYSFAALYALMLAFEQNESRGYALAGAFAGFAAGVKYTALIVPVAIFILILIHNRARNLRFTFYFLLSTFVFGIPFYARNLLFTGNPVYPFFFGGPSWDAYRAEQFSRFGSGWIQSPLKILTAPWDATIFGVEGGVDYSATIGPLLLALIPLLLFNRKQESENQSPVSNRSTLALHPFGSAGVSKSLFLFSLILYAFWLAGITESKLLIQTRLLFPAFPALAVLAAYAFDRLAALDLPQFSLQRFARLLAALVLGLTLLGYVLALASNNPLAYITGAISRDKYLVGTLGGYYDAAQFINAQLPRYSKTLALWEPRSYYINRPIQPDAILDFFSHQLWLTRDPDAIVRTWRGAGYTHILLYRRGLNQLVTTQYDPISLDDVRVLQTILARNARLLYGEPLELTSNAIARADAAPYAIYAMEPK